MDFDKLKEFLILFDIYGYSKVLNNIPLTNADNIRNQVLFYPDCYIEKETMIHEVTFPIGIIQKLYKDFGPVITEV